MSLLIITRRESDLSSVLSSCGRAEIMTPEQALDADLSVCGSIAVLFGTADGDFAVDVRLRVKLEDFFSSGKRIFLEYCSSFNYVYCDWPKPVLTSRLVAAEDIGNVHKGDILDTHANSYLRPWCLMPGSEPIFVYHDYITAHSHTDMTDDEIKKGGWAVWRYKNAVMCQLRVCDFAKARLSPRKLWEDLASRLCVWLTGCSPDYIPQPTVRHLDDIDDFDARLADCVAGGIGWLRRNLIDGGRGGIREGMSHAIYPDGSQGRALSVRTDCAGEASGAFVFGGFTEEYDALSSFVYGPMQIKGGEYDGMLRWSDSAWGVCYGDDNARALIPTLSAALLLGEKKYLPQALKALDFLADTTARDGLRPARTDNISYLPDRSPRSVADTESGCPSAHYNAWYSAALLLGYLNTKNDRYLDIGRRGLETLMSLYPETKREQSETEEICRLVLPLALLCECTGEKKHLDMLERVTRDLESHIHPFGGVAEWDTGYKANCSRVSGGECSLLADNGDPVADLLYSSNWLPIGLAWAYRATGDERYRSLWRGIAEFMIKSQIHSDIKDIDGGWARAFDMDRREIFGLPHDAGWAACCIESGWTVAEIVTGLEIMKYIGK
ncbi:MAG: hypothetical protein IJT56_08615 [Clostridia bacterium]|nr:hypothetical protein [Clostridia bacterium]